MLVAIPMQQLETGWPVNKANTVVGMWLFSASIFHFPIGGEVWKAYMEKTGGGCGGQSGW